MTVSKKQSHQRNPRNVSKGDAPVDSDAILELGPFDVLFGRGSAIAKSLGNLIFRRVVWEHRESYNKAYRNEKRDVALQVIEEIEGSDPPGRFVELVKVKGDADKFVQVDRPRVVEKTCQALREKKIGPPDMKRIQALTEERVPPAAGKTLQSAKKTNAKAVTSKAAKAIDKPKSRRSKSRHNSKSKSKTTQEEIPSTPSEIGSKPPATYGDFLKKPKRNCVKKRSAAPKTTHAAKKRKVSISHSQVPELKTPRSKDTWKEIINPRKTEKTRATSRQPRKLHFVSQEDQEPLLSNLDGIDSSPFCLNEDPTSEVLRPQALFGSLPKIPLGLEDDTHAPDFKMIHFTSEPLVDDRNTPEVETREHHLFDMMPPTLTAFFSGIFSENILTSGAAARSHVIEKPTDLKMASELNSDACTADEYFADLKDGSDDRLDPESPTTVLDLSRTSLEGSNSLFLENNWNNWKPDDMEATSSVESWKDWNELKPSSTD